MIEPLPRREREIFESLCSAGEATAADVRAAMKDPPSYSAVRTLLARLEGRGSSHRIAEQSYVYAPVPQPAKIRELALKPMVRTFFNGSAASAATALLGLTKNLSADEADALFKAIHEARSASDGRSFLGEMAWKSALISGFALGLAFVLRSRAAADRALVLRLGVFMLLLLPIIAVALPALRIEAWAAPAPAPLPLPLPSSREASGAHPSGARLSSSPPPRRCRAGAGRSRADHLGRSHAARPPRISGRAADGRLPAARRPGPARPLDRAGAPAPARSGCDAFERARLAAPDGERLRLLVSDSVPSPLSWGWRSPVILIDPDTMAEPDEADAILAHEVAHVARRDWPALMVARLAAALFWFNPLVWLLEREVVQQAEEAADCEAALRRAGSLCAHPAHAGAGQRAPDPGPQHRAQGRRARRRVRAILDRRLRERPAGSMDRDRLDPVHRHRRAGRGAPARPGRAGAGGADRARGAAARRAFCARSARPRPHAPLPPHAPPPRRPRSATSPTSARSSSRRSPKRRSGDRSRGDRSARSTRRSLEPGREMRRMSREDRERVRREFRRAVEQARVRRRVDRGQIEAAVRQAQRAAGAPRDRDLDGERRRGMARGADGMEAGARRMEEQAAHFRDRSYREQVIAREAARGHMSPTSS